MNMNPNNQALLVPDDIQQKLLAKRAREHSAWQKTALNYAALIIFALIVLSVILASGWLSADKRFAENVRVVWVKLDPSGAYNVQFDDDEKPVEFFESTVVSKLTEWMEKRFSKRRHSISTDYGFAQLMMSPTLKTDFITNFKAPEVAAKFEACDGCDQIETKVRDIENIDKDLAPGSKTAHYYTSLAFVTERTLNKEGVTVDCRNKIYTLIWRFRPKEEIVSRRRELVANPLGMEIDRADQRNDPTPINPKTCTKG